MRATTGSSLRIRAVGSVGALIEATDSNSVQRLHRWIEEHQDRAALSEVIPGARTVYITGDAAVVRRVAGEAMEAELPAIRASSPRRHVVDVHYDGPDLFDVARRLGVSTDEVVKLHTRHEYVVRFFGFAPGQAFFADLPEVLQLPRRSTPRLRVPSGAVAIANEFTVIYPPDSPGGWNLIGTRVSEPLWDSSADPPNRVDVGDLVQFRAVQ